MYRALIALVFLAGCQESEKKTNPQIEQLEAERKNLELQSLRDEVEGQGAMLDNYSQFSKEMQESEAAEDRALEIEKEIDALKQKEIP